MQEVLVEIAIRLGKVVIASIFGLLVYAVLTGPLGVPGSAQLALESWITGALVLVVVQTGIG